MLAVSALSGRPGRPPGPAREGAVKLLFVTRFAHAAKGWGDSGGFLASVSAIAIPSGRGRSRRPLPDDVPEPITLGPAEAFYTTLTNAAYAAFLIALPVILYQLYAFFNEKVDLIVDGEPQPRPITPWSGRAGP